MKRLSLQVVAATVLVALLAACSSPAHGGMSVRLDPVGTLGYSGDANVPSVTVQSRNLVFRTAPGDPEAIITGVQANYCASNGVLVESWISEPNSVSIVVPAGFTCSEPDPVHGCDVMSPGARAAYGQPSVVADTQMQLLPPTVAFQHMDAAMGNSGWWAEFTFTGTQGWYGSIEITKTFFIVWAN